MNREQSVKIADFLATGFYAGRFPVAPGTAGSAVMVLILTLLFLVFPEIFSAAWLIPMLVVLVFAGVWSADQVCRANTYGVDLKDPKQVVIDEFAGIVVSILWLEVNFKVLMLAFFAFRLFDVAKPPPVRNLEKVPGGWGIMLDDLAAGVFANLLVRLLLYLGV